MEDTKIALIEEKLLVENSRTLLHAFNINVKRLKELGFEVSILSERNIYIAKFMKEF